MINNKNWYFDRDGIRFYHGFNPIVITRFARLAYSNEYKNVRMRIVGKIKTEKAFSLKSCTMNDTFYFLASASASLLLKMAKNSSDQLLV